MRVIRQIRTTLKVLMTAKRNRLDLVRALIRRPQLLVGTAAYELGVVTSASVDPRLKVLAELKVASIVACEYCLDIGSALARHDGLTETQLRDLSDHRSSSAFAEDERLVLDLAEDLTRVPAQVSDDLRSKLDSTFTPTQLTELVTVIAWENKRARLNQGLGIRPSGFSDGKYCALPEHAMKNVGDVGQPTG